MSGEIVAADFAGDLYFLVSKANGAGFAVGQVEDAAAGTFFILIAGNVDGVLWVWGQGGRVELGGSAGEHSR